MKRTVYIQDTYPRLADGSYGFGNWQRKAKENLSNYFKRFGIEIQWVGLDNEYMAKIESFVEKHCSYADSVNSWWRATLRKISRFYTFSDSDYDQALFLDMDIVSVSDEENYFDVLDWDKVYMPHSVINRKGPITASTMYFFKYYVSNLLHDIDVDEYKTCGSGFNSFSHENCDKMLAFLRDNGLDPTNEDHFVEIINKTNKAHKHFWPKNPAVFNDEILLEIVMNSKLFDEVFYPPRFSREPITQMTLKTFLQLKPILIHCSTHPKHETVDQVSKLRLKK